MKPSKNACPQCNAPMFSARLASAAEISVGVLICGIRVATSFSVAPHARVCPSCGLIQATATNLLALNEQLQPARVLSSNVEELIKKGPESMVQLVEMLLTKGESAPNAMTDGTVEEVLSETQQLLARRLAAGGLGQLKDAGAVDALMSVLNDRDDELRLEAIWALGEIGDPRAVPRLIPFLIANEEAHGETCKDYAAEALRKLGESQLVDAVHGTMRGEEAAMAQLRQVVRPEVVAALIAALGPADFSTTAQAAKVLAGLGALEALDDLEDVWRHRFVMPDAVREACLQAIKQLRTLASLPRAPQSGATPTDSLPRVSSSSVMMTDTLPRSAD